MEEEGKFGGRLRKYIGGMGKRNLVTVGGRPIDVVEAHRVLSHYPQPALAGLEYLFVNGVSQGCD